MSVTVASILTILAALIPFLITVFNDRKRAGAATRKVLVARDTQRLRDDLRKLRTGETPPPVP